MTKEEIIRLKTMRSVLWGARDTISTLCPSSERDEFTDKLIIKLAIESSAITKKLQDEGVEKPLGSEA